ncbi:hypothetical protein ABPG74_022196 [Tetrahymena malaccensis]
MNFKQVNIGCIQKDILRSNYSVSHYCWNENEGTVLIYDGHKNLILYNLKKMKEEKKLNFSNLSKSRHVQNACYVKAYNVYFVLSDDWWMYVIRATEFEFAAKFQSEVKYAMFMHYIEHKNAFISVTNEQCHYVQVKFKTNLKPQKYSSFVEFQCEVIQHLEVQDPMSWNKGFCFQAEENKLLTWDINDVSIFNTDKQLQTVFMLKGIGNKDTNINCCIYLGKYEYLIAGYYGGAMKVWKVEQDGTNRKILMHTFDAHSRQVLSICKHSTEPKMVVSAGSDHTLKYWNIDTFQFLFSFRAANIYNHIILLSSSFFLSTQDDVTSAGYVTGSLTFLYTHSSEVIGIDKTYSYTENNKQTLKRVQLTLKNNSGLSLDSELLQDYKLSSNPSNNPVSVLYPPPVSKKILNIVTCPYNDDILFIHIETGGFCKYQFQKSTENTLFFIETIINPTQFLDFQSKPFSQQITTMKFLDIIPPKYDMDIGDAANFGYDKENQVLTLEEYQNKINELKLVAFGSEKGSIIFVSMNGQFDKIYTRFTFHRDEILELGVVKYKHNPTERYLLSFSREGFFKMVGFTNKSADLIKSITIGQNFDMMKCFENKVILTTMQGDMKMFSLKEDKNFIIKQYENTNEHERKIVTIDINLQKKFILTASKDNKIKIWNFKKIILLQINLYEKLSGATFINDQLDIVFSHSGRISLLTYKQIARDIDSGMKNAEEYSLNAKKGYSIIEDYFQNNQTVVFQDDPKISSQTFIASQKGFFSQKTKKFNLGISFQNTNSFYGDGDLASSKLNKPVKNIYIRRQTIQQSSQNPQSISPSPYKSISYKDQSHTVTSTFFPQSNHNTGNVQNSLKQDEKYITLFQQSGQNIPLNQLVEDNGKKKQSYSQNPHQNTTIENTQYNFNKVYGSPIRSERSPASSYDTTQYKINTTSKKQRYNTENHYTESSEFDQTSTSFTQPKYKISNHNLNMMNSPHYFYTNEGTSPPANSKLPEIRYKQTKKKIELKKDDLQHISNDAQKLYQPLSPEQKFVCITALPKEQMKGYKYSLLEKFAIDRIAKRLASSRRENTLNKIILKNLGQPQEDFGLQVQSSQYNPLFSNLTTNINQRKGSKSFHLQN